MAEKSELVKCPSCGSVAFHPKQHAGSVAFVRISVLTEEQAKRGDFVMGGDNGFLAKVYYCLECQFIGFYHAREAPKGSGGASIHLGGGSRIESR